MIKKKITLTEFIYDYFLLFALFSGYIGEYSILNYLNLIIGFLCFLLNKQYLKALAKSKSLCIKIVTVILFLAFLAYISPSKTYTKSNIIMLVYCLVPMLSLSLLFKINPNKTRNLMKKSFWLLNIWWVLNMVILMVQVSGIPIFIKAQWLAADHMYEDLCCGLFGKNRTHVMSLYACFIAIYDIEISKLLSKTKRKGLLGMVIITESIMLFCSLKNDNKTFFILLPFFVIIYILFNNRARFASLSKKWKKYFVVVLSALLVLPGIAILQTMGSISLFDNYRTIFDLTSTGNERTQTVVYPFIKGWALKFGCGIGECLWSKTWAFGFQNYGLCSAGTTINLTGLWFYLLYCSLYSEICFIGSVADRTKNSKLFYYVIFISIMILTVYTDIFMVVVTGIWLLFIYLAFNLSFTENYESSTMYNSLEEKA